MSFPARKLALEDSAQERVSFSARNVPKMVSTPERVSFPARKLVFEGSVQEKVPFVARTVRPSGMSVSIR